MGTTPRLHRLADRVVDDGLGAVAVEYLGGGSDVTAVEPTAPIDSVDGSLRVEVGDQEGVLGVDLDVERRLGAAFHVGGALVGRADVGALGLFAARV